MSEGLFRAGVIGAGVFGGHHARQYAQLDGVTLSAVLDPHPERAASLAAPLGGRAFSDLAAFLEAVDVCNHRSTRHRPCRAGPGRRLGR